MSGDRANGSDAQDHWRGWRDVNLDKRDWQVRGVQIDQRRVTDCCLESFHGTGWRDMDWRSGLWNGVAAPVTRAGFWVMMSGAMT